MFKKLDYTDLNNRAIKVDGAFGSKSKAALDKFLSDQGFDGWWFTKYDNNNKFLYGEKPDINLGKFIKPLKLEFKNKYVAETKNYIIEYFAESTPHMNLTLK